eukprot:m.20685 g.20685  ORF g.20685 m.20685 type:complete len:657 (-) comp6920_c0_seq1:151-2121(-)
MAYRQVAVMRVPASSAKCAMLPSYRFCVRGMATADGYLEKTVIPTLHFQDSLPKLPLPKLEDTLKRYLDSAKPVIDEETYKKTEGIVNEFLNGEGKALHEQLDKLDKNKYAKSSYISEPWFDMYLKNRSSLPINLNPQLTWRDDPSNEKNDQAVRAASLLTSAISFYRTMRDGHLSPDVFHTKPDMSKKPIVERLISLTPRRVAYYPAVLAGAYALDMSQYQNLFSSTRIPCTGRDELKKFHGSRHVVIQRGHEFFSMDVLNDDGDAISRAQLEDNIRGILAMDIDETSHPVGALTTLDRDTWAKARTSLVLDEHNKTLIEQIDSALFTICLEDESPMDLSSETHCMLHGNGRNRWFDKSISIIVTKNGRSAVNFEHAWGDGAAVLRFFDETFKDSITHTGSAGQGGGMEGVVPLRFNVDGTLAQQIQQATKSFDALTSSTKHSLMETEAIQGKQLKSCGLSKDAYTQVSFQLAHFRAFGRSVPTYESKSTVHFKHGRTETIRSASIESDSFCKTMTSGSSNEKEKAEALKAAVAKHESLTKEALFGQGWDRHLFALKNLAEANGSVPDIFKDEAYTVLSNIILSTSTLASPALDGGGFGPTGPDCYAIGYGSREVDGRSVTRFSLMTFGLHNQDFLNSLDESLNDMRDLLEADKK